MRRNDAVVKLIKERIRPHRGGPWRKCELNRSNISDERWTEQRSPLLLKEGIFAEHMGDTLL